MDKTDASEEPVELAEGGRTTQGTVQEFYEHSKRADTCKPIWSGCLTRRNIRRISYLVYPDFESDPSRSTKREERSTKKRKVGNLRTLYFALRTSRHAKFARLTRHEEQHGLLDDTATIGTRAGWQARLASAGLTVRGHRLVRGS